MEEKTSKRWPRTGIRISPELRERIEIARILENRNFGDFCRISLNAYADFIIKKHETFKPEVK